jgi:hypothetical protein
MILRKMRVIRWYLIGRRGALFCIFPLNGDLMLVSLFFLLFFGFSLSSYVFSLHFFFVVVRQSRLVLDDVNLNILHFQSSTVPRILIFSEYLSLLLVNSPAYTLGI